MHISNAQMHGVHNPDTSLQRDVALFGADAAGNECTADSKLDIDEPENENRNKLMCTHNQLGTESG